MNKAELIDAVTKDTGLSKSQTNEVLESILKNIVTGSRKSPVQLVGFGTFKEVKTKAREARNPATGQKVKVPAKKVMKFKTSKNPKY